MSNTFNELNENDLISINGGGIFKEVIIGALGSATWEFTKKAAQTGLFSSTGGGGPISSSQIKY